jgi:hypothetical protein
MNLLALAVILAGGGLLAAPAPASATWINPLDHPADGSSGVTYCCQTGTTARCCFLTGCWTKEGFCVRLG